jgi:hypothetical protein
VTDYTHCVKKEIFCQNSNDLNFITGEVVKSLNRKVETYLNVCPKEQKDGQDTSQWN